MICVYIVYSAYNTIIIIIIICDLRTVNEINAGYVLRVLYNIHNNIRVCYKYISQMIYPKFNGRRAGSPAHGIFCTIVSHTFGSPCVLLCAREVSV